MSELNEDWVPQHLLLSHLHGVMIAPIVMAVRIILTVEMLLQVHFKCPLLVMLCPLILVCCTEGKFVRALSALREHSAVQTAIAAVGRPFFLASNLPQVMIPRRFFFVAVVFNWFPA